MPLGTGVRREEEVPRYFQWNRSEARPHPSLLPQEKEHRRTRIDGLERFVSIPVVYNRTIEEEHYRQRLDTDLLLLGEKAGMRASVPLPFPRKQV